MKCEQRAEMPSGLILVMTDEVPMRDGVSEIMELAGLRAISAPHGPAGIALYRERAAELVASTVDLQAHRYNGTNV